MKRSIKLLLAAVAIMTVLCSGAWAAGTIIDGSNKPTAWVTAGSPYTVMGSVTIDDRITVTGDVKLILTDGYTLTAEQGINVSGDSTVTNSLTIEGGPLGTGSLIANALRGGLGDDAAIGGRRGEDCGTVTINGGTVTAHSSAYGAGIGGGRRDASVGGSGGNITITGGTVTATVARTAYGAAIGGGGYGNGGKITITGGTVITNAGERGAAIGGGAYGNGGNITMTGGTVTATVERTAYSAAIGGGERGNGGDITIKGGTIIANAGGSGGAAIGGGKVGDGGKITITGGVVEAWAPAGAGIGCGSDGASTEITITGGKVTATAYERAGIGGGGTLDGSHPYNGTIVIKGGEVTAVSLQWGAGIGGGAAENGGTITITGGKVAASSAKGAGIGGGGGESIAYSSNVIYQNGGSGGTVTIAGGSVDASSVWGAGIGGGDVYGEGGDVKILGGVVNARSTRAKGIGAGHDSYIQGTLSIGPDGHAWIDASSVGPNVGDFTSGVLIDGDKGTMKGETIIPAGMTAALRDGVEMTIEDGANIVNDGELYLPASMTKEQIKSMKITGTGRIYWGGRLIRPDGEMDYDGSIAESSKKFADASRAWTPDDGDWEIAIIIEDDGVDVAAVSIDGEPLDDLDWSTRGAKSGELSAKASVRTVVISAAIMYALADETAPTSHDLRITMTDGGYAEMTFWVGKMEEQEDEDPPVRKRSSGSCASGAAAVVALAALAMIKRRAK